MYVNIEFLDKEPIENVITCMNFQMDKVILFGYSEVIHEQREKTEKFLKRYCKVQEVEFFSLSHTDLQSVEAMICKTVRREQDAGNQVFFDITGGENLILVAIGMLAKELRVPIHFFDVRKDELVELDIENTTSISKIAKAAKVKLDIDMFICMQGGVVNYQMQKELKKDFDAEDEKQIRAIWSVFDKHREYWNHFSNFIRKYFVPDGDRYVEQNTELIRGSIGKNGPEFDSIQSLNSLLEDLAGIGVLRELCYDKKNYRFQYASRSVQNCLWDAGAILELYTYVSMREKYDDCQIGVHIDWDGIVAGKSDDDVLNEIDVFTLKGNIPTFMSCKSGKWSSTKALSSLYEIETVANRFGGKYAKKALVLVNPIGEAYENRAEEMEIEIIEV